MKYAKHSLAAILVLLPTLAICQPVDTSLSNEQKTSQYFDSIKNDSSELLAFLENMPKGGDLHNHLAGSIYPKN